MTDSPFARLSRQIWYYPVIRGIIAILIGLVVLVWPAAAILTAVIFLGAFWIVDGILAVVEGLRRRGTPGAGWELFFGVVGVLAGLFLVFQPLRAAATLLLVAGIWAIVGGIAIVIGSVSARRQPGWGWGVALGVVTIGFGVAVLAQPGIAAATFATFFGVYALVIGIALIALGVAVRSWGRRAERDGAGTRT